MFLLHDKAGEQSPPQPFCILNISPEDGEGSVLMLEWQSGGEGWQKGVHAGAGAHVT